MLLGAQALLHVLRILGFELWPASPFSSMTFALLVYHADSHGAVGLGLLLGLSAPDVAQMVAHPVDDDDHLVDGQALTDGGAGQVLLGLLLERFEVLTASGISRISSWMRSTVLSAPRRHYPFSAARPSR